MRSVGESEKAVVGKGLMLVGFFCLMAIVGFAFYSCDSNDGSGSSSINSTSMQGFVGERVYLLCEVEGSVHWEVIQQPEASDIELSNPNSSNPYFVPGEPGRYIYSLTVKKNGIQTYAEEITVDVEYLPHVLVDAKLRVTKKPSDQNTNTGNDEDLIYGITVGENSYWAPVENPIGFQALLLDRKDLTCIKNVFFNTSGDSKGVQESVDEMAETLLSWANSYLGGENKGKVGLLLQSLYKPFGEESDVDPTLLIESLIFWGSFTTASDWDSEPQYGLIGGLGADSYSYYSGIHHGGGPQSMQGKFFKNINGDWAFIDTAIVPISIRAGSGSDTFVLGAYNGQDKLEKKADLQGGAGGFQVCWMDKWTLEWKDCKTFVTHTGDSKADEEKIDELLELLKSLNGKEDSLVALSSIGNACVDGASEYLPFSTLGAMIQTKGGSPNAFFNAISKEKTGYSIIFESGSSPDYPYFKPVATTIEARSDAKADCDPKGKLNGYLKRNGKGAFVPKFAVSGPFSDAGTLFPPNSDFHDVFWNKTEDWPFPDWNQPDQVAAFAALSDFLASNGDYRDPSHEGYCRNIRTDYNEDLDWGQRIGLLGKVDYSEFPTKDEFSEETLNSINDKLYKEISHVCEIWTLFIDDLKTFYNYMAGKENDDLNQLYYNLLSDLQLEEDEKKDKSMSFLNWWTCLWGAASLLDEELKPVFEVSHITSLFFEAYSGEPTEDNKDPFSVLNRKAADLWADFGNKMMDEFFDLGFVFNVIVNDYAKMEYVHNKRADGEKGWIWVENGYTPHDIAISLEGGTEAFFFQTLLPSVYKIEWMSLVPYQTPHDFCWCECNSLECCYDSRRHKEPPDDDAYYCQEGALVIMYNLYSLIDKDSKSDNPIYIGKDITDQLFGLPVDKDYLITRWSFDRHYPKGWDHHHCKDYEGKEYSCGYLDAYETGCCSHDTSY